MRRGLRGLFYVLHGTHLPDGITEECSLDDVYCGRSPELRTLLSARTSKRRPGIAAAAAAIDRIREWRRGESRFFSGEAGEYERHPAPYYECPRSPHHVTRAMGCIRSLDIFGGPKLSPLLHDTFDCLLVPEEFAELMQAAGFSGLQFTEWSVACRQTQFQPPPLLHVEGTGKHFIFAREIVDGPNACGHCGYSPIICYECGETLFDCPECQRQVFIVEGHHEGEQDRRIILMLSKGDEAGCHLDASLWDGSDFTNYGDEVIVTRRVIDWLLEIGAGPWKAESAKCELATARPEQHAALLAAAGSNRTVVERALAAQANR